MLVKNSWSAFPVILTFTWVNSAAISGRPQNGCLVKVLPRVIADGPFFRASLFRDVKDCAHTHSGDNSLKLSFEMWSASQKVKQLLGGALSVGFHCSTPSVNTKNAMRAMWKAITKLRRNADNLFSNSQSKNHTPLYS